MPRDPLMRLSHCIAFQVQGHRVAAACAQLEAVRRLDHYRHLALQRPLRHALRRLLHCVSQSLLFIAAIIHRLKGGS